VKKNGEQCVCSPGPTREGQRRVGQTETVEQGGIVSGGGTKNDRVTTGALLQNELLGGEYEGK